MTPTRRPFAFVPSTIVLIVALLASSAGIAVTSAGATDAPRHAVQTPLAATINGAPGGRATEPESTTRFVSLPARALSTGRLHATRASEGMRHTVVLGGERTSLALVSIRVPGAAVDARADGVTTPGQPAPSSRAPPIG